MITVKVSKEGSIQLPEEFRAKSGIKEGTKFDIFDKGDYMVLVRQLKEHPEELHGLLSAEPSLTDELLEERARDRNKEEERIGKKDDKD